MVVELGTGEPRFVARSPPMDVIAALPSGTHAVFVGLTQPSWAPLAEASLDTIEPALAQAIVAALFSRMVPVSTP